MSTQTESRTTWQIDPAHSQVEFSVKHMMFTTVRGRFGDVSGTIETDEANPSESSVRVEIAAASIDTQVADRDKHLKSGDFLDVEQYPEITFRSTRVEGAAFEPGSEFKVFGELTIHGETKEIELAAVYGGQGTDPWGNRKAGFSADGRIDRRDFGLTWNQALETGGVLVGNELKIHIEAQAAAQSDETD